MQSDVGNFAYFVERANPFDVRFTLPVVMCVHVIDGGFMDAFQLKLFDREAFTRTFDREAFTRTFGRAVTNEAVGFFRDHSPHFADGSNQLYLPIASLMVDGSAEKLKFLMMGARGGCGKCARLAMDHLEREAATIAKLSALLPRPGAASPTSVDAMVEDMDKLNVSVEIEPTRESHIQSPDPSGALYVLSLLDKLDDQEARARAAAPAGQQNAPASKPSAWRRASKDDYGVAMRAALEELAERDRRERVRSL